MNMGRMHLSSTGHQRKRGFTLTEIAIVLGIIGLILGAIWVAASAVYQNLRTSKATTELLTVAQAVRTMYATSASVDAGADMPAAFAASTVGAANATYIAAGVFPTDTLNTGNPATATIVTDPWSGGIAIVAAKATVASDSFAIEFNKVPTTACITLFTGNTGTGRDVSLLGLTRAKSSQKAMRVRERGRT